MANKSNSARKDDPQPQSVVLINRDHNRKHIPYGRKSGSGAMLGVAGQGPGISELHVIHPGINPPISSELWEKIKDNTALIGWMKKRTIYTLEIDVADMEHESCESMLKRSSSIEGLKYWLKNETRSDWKKKLKPHIAEMEEHARKTGRLEDETSGD